jgi:hypothetical protein
MLQQSRRRRLRPQSHPNEDRRSNLEDVGFLLGQLLLQIGDEAVVAGQAVEVIAVD